MEVKPIDDNAVRETFGPDRSFMPSRVRHGGHVPIAASGQASTVWAQAEGVIAALAHVSEKCKHIGNELERELRELQGMLGKMPSL